MTNADNHNTHNKLRIALLVDSNMDSKYVYDLAEWGQRQNDLEVTHLLIQNLPANNSKIHKVVLLLKKRGFIYTSRAVGLGLIEKVETLGIRRVKAFENHMNKYDLSNSVKNIISMNPIVSKSGFVYRYEHDEIQKIKELNLDIIVRCGSGILRG